jgi:hypothetical protein
MSPAWIAGSGAARTAKEGAALHANAAGGRQAALIFAQAANSRFFLSRGIAREWRAEA